jgi:hypothetical protein|tara:strand:+ start:370 stop:651 length:282 start_codon:yes stop_codon:yes gene_type:complete
MQRTIILKPQSIMQYKSMIGVVLYNENDTLTFSTGHKVYRIKEKDLTHPLNDLIEKTFNRNDELKHLAIEHDIIEIQERDSIETYLSYVKTYN